MNLQHDTFESLMKHLYPEEYTVSVYEGNDAAVLRDIDGRAVNWQVYERVIGLLIRGRDYTRELYPEGVPTSEAPQTDKPKATKPALKQRRGFVYVVQSPTGAYKIGKAKDPEHRLKTFAVKLPFEVEFTALLETDDMHGLECSLHEQFADKCVNGEWFNLEPEDIEYIKSLQGE